jgi:spore photoproduct lyase
MPFDYGNKFETFAEQAMYRSLSADDRSAVREAAFAHRLTFQEFRRVVEVGRDLAMWGEGTIGDWLAKNAAKSKSAVLADLERRMEQLRSQLNTYDPDRPVRPNSRETRPVVKRESDKAVFGMCPVASPKTVCCNLRTIDAVENCVFARMHLTLKKEATKPASFKFLQ